MKTITQLKKLFFLSILFLMVGNVWGQTLSQNYNVAQNYYSNNFQKNLDLVNTVFNKSYTTYLNQNPGNLNGEFLSGPWPPATGATGSTHKGVDYRAQQPHDLYSPLSGVVTAFGGSSGKICIYNSTFNLTFIFIHCSIYNVSVGQNIVKGQYIGKTGEVGAPGAPHLHVELRSGSQNFAATSQSAPTNNYDPRIIMDFFPVCSTTPPITTTPSNTQTNVGIPVFFNWDDVSGTNPQYRVQVSTTSSGWTSTNGFTTATSPSGNIKVNTNTNDISNYSWSQYQNTGNPFTPQGNTTYYYTVKAFVCGQNSNWSSVKSFTTGCLAGIPTLLSPSNGQTNVSNPVNFDWQDDNGTSPQYRIQVSTTSNGWSNEDGFTTNTSPSGNVIVNINTSNVSSYQWNNAQSNTTYYWTVRTNSCLNNSPWSPVRSFTIGSSSGCNPPTVTLNSPTNATTYNVGQIINLVWSGNGNGCTIQDYQIEITAPNGNTTSPMQTLNNFDFTATTAGIGTWQWRVRARNINGVWGNYTSLRTFIINQTNSCLTCPNFDNTLTLNSSWGNHSSSIQSNGCKIYRFLAVPNKLYSFKTGCDNGAAANFDTYLELLDNNCNSLITNDDGCANNTSKIDWNCNYSAINWVYLKVSGYNANAFGNFTLAYLDVSSLDIEYLEFNNSNLSVYPNPFQDFLTIVAKEDNLQYLQLIDLQGRIIKQEKVSGSNHQFNLESLPQGVYILQINSDKGMHSVKVIKK